MNTVNEQDPNPVRPALGSLLFFLGLGLLGLMGAERAAGLPVNMPRSWYIDRSAWIAAALAALGTGWHLLGDRRTPDEEGSRDASTPTPRDPAGLNPPDGAVLWKRRLPPGGPRFERVVFYTRAGCHLCETARETLDRYGDFLPPLIEVDLDADPEANARFSTCIPVVEIDGKIRFRGRVNEVLLRRLIEATPPPPK